MRILKISDVFFPRVNGVSTSIQTFMRELGAAGHEVELIAPDYPGGPADQLSVTRIASRRLAFDPEDRLMRGAPLRALLPRLRERRFDLVHVHTPFRAHYAGLALGRALGVPVVETYHTFFEEYLHHYVPVLPRPCSRWVARRFSRRQCDAVDAVVVPSSAMEDALRGYGCRAPVHVCPTGIEPALFRPGNGSRFRERHGIAPERPLLLYVGRAAHEKNIGFLLDAVARLVLLHPDFLFLICGEGPAQQDLRRQVFRLGLEHCVRFLGYLERDTELRDCYRAADVFVFASRTETQGLVLLEALAQGLPVVSTAVMGTCDIVGPERGALVAREDVADFADKLARVLSDAHLRRNMAQEGSAFARSWAAQPMAERLAGIYHQVIGSSRPVPAADQLSEEKIHVPQS